MARRGFISPKVFLHRAYDRNIRLHDAQAAVVEALPLGKLECEGRRLATALERLEFLMEGQETDAGQLKPSKVALIPSSTWFGLSENLVAEWDWNSGVFKSIEELGAPRYWHSVKLNEKQCNDLLDRLQLPRHHDSQESLPRERRRGPSWDEWVSVIAELAYEHLIDAQSTDRDILELAAARLGFLHEPGKQTKRMKTAAQAIVNRWKTKPPTKPAPIRQEFSDPTRKP